MFHFGKLLPYLQKLFNPGKACKGQTLAIHAKAGATRGVMIVTYDHNDRIHWPGPML